MERRFSSTNSGGLNGLIKRENIPFRTKVHGAGIDGTLSVALDNFDEFDNSNKFDDSDRFDRFEDFDNSKNPGRLDCRDW